jgi:quinoprotein dehydrogenase-associated probable ABC transporter substrate-binding protein
MNRNIGGIGFLIFTNLFTFLTAQAEEKFRVCADPLHPPYSTKQLNGYENKIAALFAEQLGQELEYYWFPDRMAFIRNTLKAENDKSAGYKCDIIIGLPTGSELAETTRPYLHSTYVLLIAKNRGWNDIAMASQLQSLPPEKLEQLKIAMFDRGPGTEWLQKNGLLEKGVPYQSMSGDNEHNVAMQINRDLQSGVIDMAILWGPIAGYVQMQNPPDSFIAIPMQSTTGVRFDFSISMAVRQAENDRKSKLDQLIEKNQPHIDEILDAYHIVRLPLNSETKQADHD